MEWDHSTDARVRGYHVYIHNEAFDTTEEAQRVGEVRASNAFLITNDVFAELTNQSPWHVAAVPFDDSVSKTTVTSVLLASIDGEDGTGPTAVEEGDGLQLESLLTGPNMIAAGMVLIILLLLVIVVRGRRNQPDKRWELQEATWGIESDAWGASNTPAMPVPVPPPGISASDAVDLYAAAERIQTADTGRPAYQAVTPTPQPQVDPSLLDGLVDQPQPSPQTPNIDTSFLDDLL